VASGTIAALVPLLADQVSAITRTSHCASLREVRVVTPDPLGPLVLGGQDFKTRAAATSALAAVCVSEPAQQQAVAEAGILTALPEVVRDAYDSVQLFGCKLLAVFLERAAWWRESRRAGSRARSRSW
jgi:hypothetical protein